MSLLAPSCFHSAFLARSIRGTCERIGREPVLYIVFRATPTCRVRGYTMVWITGQALVVLSRLVIVVLPHSVLPTLSHQL